MTRRLGMFVVHLAWLAAVTGHSAGAQGTGSAVPGVIHFEDGSRLAFFDLLKLRVGPHPGVILLEPRGIYLQEEQLSGVLVPVSQLRELSVVDYRLPTKTQCRASCGIHASRLAIKTTAGLTTFVKVGFADSLIVAVRDEDGQADVRAIPWAMARRDTVRLHIRRIVFGAGPGQ